MQENTVLLSVKEYNELRDFKKEVEENLTKSKFAVITNGYGYGLYSHDVTTRYYTQDEAILDFENKNKELKEEICELKSKLKKSEIKEPVEVTIDDLKNMSYWEFRKWRKS